MTTTLTLPERLDLQAAHPLVREIAETSGDLSLDASAVTHLDGLCLQILLAAQQYCQASGRRFNIANQPDSFDTMLIQLGIDPRRLTGTAAA
ncbi:MAG: STAS domain-containing protein [Paracoccus sp. (in: a-proteobacteria)]